MKQTLPPPDRECSKASAIALKRWDPGILGSWDPGILGTWGPASTSGFQKSRFSGSPARTTPVPSAGCQQTLGGRFLRHLPGLPSRFDSHLLPAPPKSPALLEFAQTLPFIAESQRKKRWTTTPTIPTHLPQAIVDGCRKATGHGRGWVQCRCVQPKASDSRALRCAASDTITRGNRS